MAFFREVREDIRNIVEKDPAARNGFEVFSTDRLTGCINIISSLSPELFLSWQDGSRA